MGLKEYVIQDFKEYLAFHRLDNDVWRVGASEYSPERWSEHHRLRKDRDAFIYRLVPQLELAYAIVDQLSTELSLEKEAVEGHNGYYWVYLYTRRAPKL